MTTIVLDSHESNKVLEFDVTIDGVVANLYEANLQLIVDGNARSPFPVTVTDTLGVAQYVTQPGDFPGGSGGGIRVWICFVKYIKDTVILIGDEFTIVSV